MGKSNLELVICRTCLRDNPGAGNFSDFETNAKSYQEALKAGLFKKTAQVKFQNCFAQCENFYCVQVTQGGEGFLLKQVSTLEKQQELLDWLKESKRQGQLELPESFSEHLIAPVKPQEKYKKF